MTTATTSTRMRSVCSHLHVNNAMFALYTLQVYRVNQRSGQVEFGMVVENSELYSSDEEEPNAAQQDQRTRQRPSRHDGNEDSRLRKGFVRVAWYPKGDEQVESADYFHFSELLLQ